MANQKAYYVLLVKKAEDYTWLKTEILAPHMAYSHDWNPRAHMDDLLFITPQWLQPSQIGGAP